MEESKEKRNEGGKRQQREEKQHIRARDWRIARIKKYTLFSDTFMNVALKDIPACQHVLRIMTGLPDLIVKEVRSQYWVSRIPRI